MRNSHHAVMAAILTAGLGLGACTKKQDAEAETSEEDIIVDFNEDSDDPAASLVDAVMALEDDDAPEADGTERFFGKRAFTIVSTQTGAEEGSVVEHVREWGRKRVEIKDTQVSMAGFTQQTSQRVIYDGDGIVTVDGATGRVTTATNPLYNSIVNAMKGKSGVEFGKEMMNRMGGRLTGEKGSFAGHDCEYWEISAAMSKACVTAWGGTLHTSVNMAGMSMEKTATEVRMNDGGPDEAFKYDASKAQAAPNLEDIMKQMQGGN